MPNFLPVFTDAEDEETMQNHWSSGDKNEEFQQKNKDNVTHQRHLMITNMENYQKVTDLYPILCDEEQVCCECKT